jgi:hypothetical protein
MPQLNKFSIDVLTEDVATRAHAQAREDFQSLSPAVLSRLSSKQRSEFFGAFLEAAFADAIEFRHGHSSRQPEHDREPDLNFLNGHTMEVKNTSTDVGWRGGKYSKRPGDYILVSYDKNDNKIFVALAALTEDDWTRPTSNSYYGTTFTADDLERVIEDGRGKVILGSFRYGPRNGKAYLNREYC